MALQRTHKLVVAAGLLTLAGVLVAQVPGSRRTLAGRADVPAP